MKPLLLIPAILILAASARSQGSVDGYPFGIPADPRSVAMGESFVALASNPAALLYNPAGLAGFSARSSLPAVSLDLTYLVDIW
jgi:hypothetical protein